MIKFSEQDVLRIAEIDLQLYELFRGVPAVLAIGIMEAMKHKLLAHALEVAEDRKGKNHGR